MEKTAVTCVCWIPRGKCSAKPKPDDNDDEELREAHAELADGAAASNLQGVEEFGLENYDDEEEGMQFFSVLNNDGELARERDPHLNGDPDSDSDSEDYYEIKPEDQIFIAASCEEDNCQLEMYIYDEEDAGMYVHHDLLLGAYPLCVEWLEKTSSSDEGNFAAIGLIDNTIQIWDLDRLDPVDPAQMLGTSTKPAKAKKKNKKRLGGTENVQAHNGAVMCLHGSQFNRSVLASGGGDDTVKVWDVREGSCVHTYNHHTGKVQVVKWHPTEQAVLLSAAFDRKLALLDVRQPNQSLLCDLPTDAEHAVWSRHRPFECYASVDNGCVLCYDVRKVSSRAPHDQQVLWTVQAHDVACTTLQDSPAPNLLVTAGLDGVAKVWDLAGAGPSMVLSKDLQAGPIFTSQSNPEAPALMCFGGKCPVLWDLTSEQLLTDVFKFAAPAAI